MKSFLAAIAACIASLPLLAATPSDVQLDAAMAFARTYGIVRYFHPSDSLDRVDWNRFLVYGAHEMEGVADTAAIGPALESLFPAPVADFKVVPKGAPAPAIEGEGPIVEWRHLGYGVDPMPASQPYVSWRTHHKPLNGGDIKGAYFQHEHPAELVKEDEPVLRIPVAGDREALVPVSMPMSATKVGEAQDAKLKELSARLQPVTLDPQSFTRSQACAIGISAWNVARHFYPYWPVVSVDWEAALRSWLAAQPETQSRDRLRDQLRRLIAPLVDGHGRIADAQDTRARAMLPISVRPLGDRWVVEASFVPRHVKPGDVIATVDGIPASTYFERLLALQSGSPQFVRWRAAFEFERGVQGTAVTLGLERGAQRLEVALKYVAGKIGVPARPESFSEVKPGVFYVDLMRFDKAAFEAARPKLAAAKAIVFDMRGYPSQGAAEIVKSWLTGPDNAQWLIVPRFDKPFGQYVTGWSTGWQVERDASLEKPRKLLLIDGRAVSFAESLIGYFAGQKTGRIVGERSAGANGNIGIAKLPGGFDYVFTGMKVTRHDGSVFHGEGFAPDEEVAPSAAGLAAGRDEVLERAHADAAQP
jgi:C-terminal processing protease CtpA/Prc